MFFASVTEFFATVSDWYWVFSRELLKGFFCHGRRMILASVGQGFLYHHAQEFL